MSRFCLALVLLGSLMWSPDASAQKLNIDSVRGLLRTSKGIERAKQLEALAWAYGGKDIDSAFVFLKEALKLANASNDRQFLAKCYNTLGELNFRSGNIKPALNAFRQAVDASIAVGDSTKLAAYLANLGKARYEDGQPYEAIKIIVNARQIARAMGDGYNVYSAYINQAVMYRRAGRYAEAKKQYLAALRMSDSIEVGPVSVARLYGNLGALEGDIGNIEQVRAYYYKALALRLESGIAYEIGQSYLQIASLFYTEASNGKENAADSLMYYSQLAIDVFDEVRYARGLLIAHMTHAEAYELKGEFKNAIADLMQIKELTDALQSPAHQNQYYLALASNYRGLKQFNRSKDFAMKALSAVRDTIYGRYQFKTYAFLEKLYREQGIHEIAYLYKDSSEAINKALLLEGQKKELQWIEAEYKNENQKKEIEALNAKTALQESELARDRLLFWSAGGTTLVFGLMLIVILRNARIRKKINEQLLDKNAIIESKNADIMDSIAYAKRIQAAILPPLSLVKEWIPKSFVLYNPKDIVAGDFYWMHSLPQPNGWDGDGDTILIGAADCTGHGVPGAMVSVVCSTALDRAVQEFGITKPGPILDKVRELVVETFEQSEEDVKDGMDVALCAISPGKVQFAGANNPLWIVRKGELIETKGTKQPIGKVDNPQPFITHEIELEPGDCLYFFTDGFADQFGGPRGKKFKSKPMKQLLLSIADLSINEQKIKIQEAFTNWKGNLEQVDDVCLIGIRV